ncbi:MAG: hypothetical protein IJO76_05895 [Clostridia bacterium]|nr:hypothetical protein [Clostridia bacterium]
MEWFEGSGLYEGKLFYGSDPKLNGYNPNCEWFMNAKYGISVGYLSHSVNAGVDFPERLTSMGKQTDWETCVNELDVQKCVDTLAKVQPGYVMLTMQQCDTHTCAPNATLDALLGAKPGENCSTRDLVIEFSDALKKYNIPLMLYVTADGMWKSPEAMSKLCEAEFPTDPSTFKAHHWTAAFKRKWFAAHREWSMRYGDRIAGWWVDGADACKGYSDVELLLFKQNLLAGNPNAIVTFNPGGDRFLPWRYSIADDYTAGESCDFDDYPEERWVNGAQWHEISYLEAVTNRCAKDGSDPTEFMVNYVKAVTEKQGVLTIDFALFRDGHLDEDHLAIMRAVKEAVKG